MKQKTLQTQYNLIKEGKGNKEIFLKESKRIFPNYISNVATFDQAENILKQRNIISENKWGIATGRDEKPDWFAIFNENMNESKGDDEIAALEKEASKYNRDDIRYKELQKKIGDLKSDKEYALPGSKAAEKFSESINEEAKAVEKKTSKEVTDLEEKNFDYKDKKNVDNVYGEAFLKGYYCEMKDPKNADKTVDELKEIVAKNLAKDQLHYVKAGQFGEEGVGYTDELPGLKASKSDQMEKVKLQESKESLKEYTDTDFSGQDTLMRLDEPSYEAEGAFEKFFPMGYASQDDAADALMAHDKSPIKARMGRYAPMFVHVQYHEFTDEAGEEYRVHQTQYYNSNFKDDPDFNPRVTVLTLTKLADPDVRLGQMAVKTDEYIKDLKNLNVGDRVSESKESLKESNPFAKIKELGRNYPNFIDSEYQGEKDRLGGDELYTYLVDTMAISRGEDDFISKTSYGLTDETSSLSPEDVQKLRTWYKKNYLEVSESTTPSLLDLIGESYDEFQRDDKGDKDVTAQDKGEEDAYGAGVEKGEEIEKAKKKKKVKKETIETKLAEIDKASSVVALEAKINAIAEMIESKSQRLEMVNEDSDLAELVDKGRVKAIQKEIKDLEKRKLKMEKLYEKSCGKKYQQQEIVDETQIEEDIKSINEELYDFVRDIKSAVGTNNNASAVIDYLGRRLSKSEYAALAQAGVIRGRR